MNRQRPSLRPARRRPALGCRPSAAAVLHIAEGTLSVRERVDVVLRDDAVFRSAEVIPAKGEGSVGRRRTYPDFVWTLWPVLRDIFGSHTAVQRELGRGGWWRYIRRELRRLRPELPELPAEPPRRQAYEYYRDSYLATDQGIRRSQEIHTKLATEQAKEAGNLDPNGGGSFTHPDITRCQYGDGKVIDSLYKAKPGTRTVNRATGQAREIRSDPDASFHTEGGGDKVYGIKFSLLSTRRPEGRFILAAEHVGKDKDEAKAAIEMLRRTKPYAPGAQAVVWDMILRGEHLQIILTELGLLPVVGVHAKENPSGAEGRRSGSYIPKTADLDDIPVLMPDGTTRLIHIAAVDGAVAVKELTETGDPYYQRLGVVRIQRHADKRGFRFYGFYRLPQEHGGAIISVRLHQNADDERRHLNRTENLRPIPEGSEDFARLHRLRRDAESINRGVEDALFINRASAKGWKRQMVDLLGHARLVNAVTLARCRAKARLPDAA